jgi:hypothetical protein
MRKWSELPSSLRGALMQARAANEAANGQKKKRGTWREYNQKVKAERKGTRTAKRRLYRDDLPWLN